MPITSQWLKIDLHYTRTVSEWTKDYAVSFGLRDMTRRFRDCLGR